jgi:hypothetical protein
MLTLNLVRALVETGSHNLVSMQTLNEGELLDEDSLSAMEYLYQGAGKEVVEDPCESLTRQQLIGSSCHPLGASLLRRMWLDGGATEQHARERWGQFNFTYLGCAVLRLVAVWDLYMILSREDINLISELTGVNGGKIAYNSVDLNENELHQTWLDVLLTQWDSSDGSYESRVEGWGHGISLDHREHQPLLFVWLQALHKGGVSLRQYFQNEERQHTNGVVYNHKSYRRGWYRKFEVEYGNTESEVRVTVRDEKADDFSQLERDDDFCHKFGLTPRWKVVPMEAWTISTRGFASGDYSFKTAGIHRSDEATIWG